jgi:hypothetical protein
MNKQSRKTGEKACGPDSCLPAFLILLGALILPKRFSVILLAKVPTALSSSP